MSRQKSGRASAKPAARGAKAAKPARGASPARATGRGVLVQQPKSDIFVVMLGIALGAILLGCILLLLVWGRYDYKTSPNASIRPAGAAIALTAADLNKISTVRL